MEYWLHRVSHEEKTSRPLLEKGILTIGFSALSSSDFLSKTKAAQRAEELNSAVKKAYGDLLQFRSLWLFLKKMQVGDWVLVPGRGTFSVYVIKGESKLIADIDPKLIHRLQRMDNAKVRIEGDRLKTGDKVIDLGFYREVEVYRIGNKKARNISRSNYADRKLNAAMKFLGTNLDISNLESNLKEALETYKKNQPLNFYSDVMDCLAPKLLTMMYKRLNPQKFESLLKYYFERIGATNVWSLSKNQRDKKGDADIIASFDPIKVVICIQAKFHAPDSTTKKWAVEQIVKYKDSKEREAGSSDEHKLICWVVSTCEKFDDECIEMAKAHGVVLINGIEFARMLLDVGIEHLEI